MPARRVEKGGMLVSEMFTQATRTKAEASQTQYPFTFVAEPVRMTRIAHHTCAPHSGDYPEAFAHCTVYCSASVTKDQTAITTAPVCFLITTSDAINANRSFGHHDTAQRLIDQFICGVALLVD